MLKLYPKLTVVSLLLIFVLSACSKEDFRTLYTGWYLGTITLALEGKPPCPLDGSEREVYIELDPSDDKSILLKRSLPLGTVKLSWVNGEWIVPTQTIRTLDDIYGVELTGTIDLSDDILDYQFTLINLNPELTETGTLTITSTAIKQRPLIH